MNFIGITAGEMKLPSLINVNNIDSVNPHPNAQIGGTIIATTVSDPEGQVMYHTMLDFKQVVQLIEMTGAFIASEEQLEGYQPE